MHNPASWKGRPSSSPANARCVSRLYGRPFERAGRVSGRAGRKNQSGGPSLADGRQEAPPRTTRASLRALAGSRLPGCPGSIPGLQRDSRQALTIRRPPAAGDESFKPRGERVLAGPPEPSGTSQCIEVDSSPEINPLWRVGWAASRPRCTAFRDSSERRSNDLLRAALPISSHIRAAGRAGPSSGCRPPFFSAEVTP